MSPRLLLDDLADWIIGKPEGDWSDRYTRDLERICAGGIVVAFVAAFVVAAVWLAGYA